MAQSGGRRSAKSGPRAQWRTLDRAAKASAKTANTSADARRHPRAKVDNRAPQPRRASTQRYLEWASFMTGPHSEFGYGVYFSVGSEP